MKKQKGSMGFNIINNIFLSLVSLVCLIPFYLVIITSFTKEKYIQADGYKLFPRGLTLDAYKWVLGGNSTVFNSYKVTIFITAAGTVLGLILVSMVAYAASRKHLKYRNVISMIVYIPMVFYGGLVPFYMVLINLGLKNSILGLFVPILIAPMNVFLMINYFRGLPDAVMESAKIDGADDFRTFIKIVLPMSAPVIATVALFIMLQIWNEWVLSLLLIDDSKKYPLQFLLRQIIARVSYAQSQSQSMVNAAEMPQESVKMATVVVTLGPIVLVYPFIQKYFVKGITVGAVKG